MTCPTVTLDMAQTTFSVDIPCGNFRDSPRLEYVRVRPTSVPSRTDLDATRPEVWIQTGAWKYDRLGLATGITVRGSAPCFLRKYVEPKASGVHSNLFS